MLWFVAIPFLDCVGLIFSRLKRGLSWSSPGRDHIHHKLMNYFSPEKTLLVIISISLMTGLFGILIDNYFSANTSFIIFIAFSILYFTFAHFLPDKQDSNIENV